MCHSKFDVVTEIIVIKANLIGCDNLSLLQIATAWFITKCDGQLLQIARAFLLQGATRFITNCDRYYKVR